MPLPRKRRIRAPRKWSQDIGDLHDYVKAPPQRAYVGKTDTEIAVSDDWPDQVPISDAELRVIEGHLRSELDKLFGPLP
ncbi:hypothetical protein ACFSUK_26970 [Sphingobium scionense]|uniref:Uncharacterized protein n=2 Tax=Sphingomonadaceae TaxID=41297 RepID=A0A7X4K720_9SPHN|nr:MULTISPECIES: hypothetical protein [Sphingomonadaceae]MBB4148618.1 hypothetical protein [Sphingobium scionense]MDR6787374.1 hypothetical protein [Sphingomonas sp. BE138]MYL96818.1 hypothetical protein [Novosphingobium silvae]